MKPMRILIVQETNWLDRNVIHQHHLGERLAQRGHFVDVIDYDILWPEKENRPWRTPRQVFQNVNRVVQGISLTVTRPATVQKPLVCHLTWAIGSLIEMKRIIKNARPDVVIGLSLTNSLPMAVYLNKVGIPYISMVLEPYHTMMPQVWARKPARLIEALTLRRADRVVVFTTQMRQYVQDLGAAPERIIVFKTGVSLDVFRPGMEGRAQRIALGIEPHEWVLFFMGWLYDFSGLREIVSYLGKNRNHLDGARLLIIGNGDIYWELKELTAQFGLHPKVLLTGRRPYGEVPSLLAAADVCLLPSVENPTTRDIVPMKVYEYLAAGKPVVASRLPGLLAEFGMDNGILYGNDPVDVLKRAQELKGFPKEAHLTGAAGRRFAEQNADWDKTAEVFEQLLSAIVQDQKKGVECSAPI
jgi:glycosyltransferase involved in cell wall biosynthesis